MATHSSILRVSIKCKWKKIFARHLDSGYHRAELDLCWSCCYCCYQYLLFTASLVAQMVKNLPAVQGTRVQSLGREDSLDKGMATRSSILAWKTPWTAEPSGLQPAKSQI